MNSFLLYLVVEILKLVHEIRCSVNAGKKIKQCHHMGNTWFSLKISHSTGKCNKTYGMGRFWEIDTHTFPIVWVLLSHPIPILWYTSAYGKCMGFPINFPQYGKMQQNPWYGDSLGNWYSYFSRSMGAFFPLDSHPMAYFVIWEMHGFPHQFPIVQENATKIIAIWRTRVIGAHTFPILWTLFFQQIPILWYTSSHGKCMCFLINFP